MNKARQCIKTLIFKLKILDYKTPAGQTTRDPVFWVRFSAYAIPLVFLIWVLWWNYSPLGYNKTYVIDVGSKSDITGRFYLEHSKDLSESKTDSKNNNYREINGTVYAIYKPKFVLKDTRLVFEAKGGDIFMMPLSITDDYTNYTWEYNWDFTQNKLPEELIGNIDLNREGCAYFNGIDTRLELRNSKDLFETEAFTVYAKWRPDNNSSSSQQIIGHYNWELWQNKDNVEFRVGRMNDAQGRFYSIKAHFLVDTEDFFSVKHSMLATYNPTPDGGYIDLYVDELYAGRTYFGIDRIWQDYNGNRNISLGKSDHRDTDYFRGCIYNLGITKGVGVNQSKSVSFRLSGPDEVQMPIMSKGTASLNKIILHVQNH
jgi:hypothetical protein